MQMQMNRLMPGEDGEHITYCRLCESQCGLIAKVQDGKIVHVGPDREHVVSAGRVCIKGTAAASITNDPDRVTKPLKRGSKPGEFTPVSWDEALGDIAQRLKEISDAHGDGSVGVYTGNPSGFVSWLPPVMFGFANKFKGKIYGAMHVDTVGKQLGSELVYGSSMRWTFPDLERCDFLLMLGANPMVSQLSLISEPLYYQKLNEIAERGAVVVVDPRRTETAARYEHQPIQPDSDAWLLSAMINVLIEENFVHEDFLEQRVSGWADLKNAVQQVSMIDASTRCGIPEGRIRELALRFANAPRAACYGRLGTNRGTFSTLVNVLMEALNLVTGNFAKPGGNVFGSPLFDDSFPIPAYGSSKARLSQIPLILGLSPTAEMADDILTEGDAQLRALFVTCGNPVLGAPDPKKQIRALEKIDLLVSMDLYINETNRYADYVLPGTTMFERSDLSDLWVKNAPRPWLQYTDAVVPPVAESRHESLVYEEILERVGLPGVLAEATGKGNGEKATTEDCMSAQLEAHGEGLTLDKLRREHPHGLALRDNVDAENSWNRVSFADKKPRLWCTVIASEFERFASYDVTAGSGELKLFGRRMLKSLNSWMHNVERLVRSDTPTLMIHPQDARARNIGDGAEVIVSSKSGTVRVVAEVTDQVVAGSVCYPHGWGHNGSWSLANEQPGVNINELASSEPEDWEPVSGACLLDGIPVKVQPA